MLTSFKYKLAKTKKDSDWEVREFVVPIQDFLGLGLLAQKVIMYERSQLFDIASGASKGALYGDPLMNMASCMESLLDFISVAGNHSIEIGYSPEHSMYSAKIVAAVTPVDPTLVGMGIKQDHAIAYSMNHVDRAKDLFMNSLSFIAVGCSGDYTEIRKTFPWISGFQRLMDGLNDALLMMDEEHTIKSLDFVASCIEGFSVEDREVHIKIKRISEQFGDPIERIINPDYGKMN